MRACDSTTMSSEVFAFLGEGLAGVRYFSKSRRFVL